MKTIYKTVWGSLAVIMHERVWNEQYSVPDPDPSVWRKLSRDIDQHVRHNVNSLIVEQACRGKREAP